MTKKAFLNLKHGENNIVVSPWICSKNDNNTYLHTYEFAKNETLDNDEAFHFGIQQAKESAIIQSVINGDDVVYVIQIEVPDHELEIDYSCSNMEHCRYISCERFNELFHNSENVSVCEFPFNQAFAAFVIASIVDFEQFNRHDVTPSLLSVANIIKKVDYSSIWDEIYN